MRAMVTIASIASYLFCIFWFAEHPDNRDSFSRVIHVCNRNSSKIRLAEIYLYKFITFNMQMVQMSWCHQGDKTMCFDWQIGLRVRNVYSHSMVKEAVNSRPSERRSKKQLSSLSSHSRFLFFSLSIWNALFSSFLFSFVSPFHYTVDLLLLRVVFNHRFPSAQGFI